jgi:tetratricopeptide (TPR) repeat protein
VSLLPEFAKRTSLTLMAGLVCLMALPGPQNAVHAKTSNKNTKDPADKNCKLGKELYKKGDYDGAIDALLQSTYFARNGYAPEAFYYLGLAYKAKGQDLKAVDALTHHLQQTIEKAAPGHLALCQVYTRLKTFDKANEQIVMAFGDSEYKDPIYPDLFVAQGELNEAQGNFGGACDCYLRALGDHKSQWDRYYPWIRYAECLMKLKDWIKAYSTLTEMTKTSNPLVGIKYDRVYLDMGICMLTKGSHQGAIENWHKALEYEPDNKEVHLQLAMLFEAEKHLSSAVKEYRHFIRCSKDEVDGPRRRQVEQRIATIEQKLAVENVAPSPTNLSPYMRNQEQMEVDSRLQEQQKQLKNLPSDAGF